MLAAALEAEVDDYLAASAAERDEQGRRLVVRNGHARQREVTTVAGAVAVRAPRVNDRRIDPQTGQRVRFRSVILPPWCRKSPRSLRCCRCCICMGCRPATSCPRWRRSSARRRGCQPRPSVGCLAPGRPTTKHFASVTWPSGTMWTSGRMGSTSGPFGAGPPVLSGAGGRARRRHQGAGRGRRWGARVDRVVGGAAGGICAAAGWGRRWSRSATARWACGPPCAMSSQPPASSATGSTSSPRCSTPCPTASRPARGRRWRDPGCPRPRPRRRVVRPRLRRQVAQGGGQQDREDA